MLAKQNLPKCHPDEFKGDVAMLHSWKRSFKAMIRDADIAPEQELNFLRRFTRMQPSGTSPQFPKKTGRPPCHYAKRPMGGVWKAFWQSSGAPTGPNRTAAHCCQPQGQL
ncbi:hypothetical protein P5673_018505 [Acropora cervicornis]|uniref:Uncharacterized protein n=1 Tax=Acropora cervicornis TaxID=6130 RepID=A0AAD9V2J6_ACRCE|nr:hypothetical protein P5673_018505 [Acropora cervicornis]